MLIVCWNSFEPDESQVQNLVQHLDISPITAGVLVNRGYSDPEEAQEFLSAEFKQLADPDCLKDADKAVDRIRRAISASEKIRIYGDYDCDGLTATALLYLVIDECGGEVDYQIPSRFVEGYGLSCEAVRQAESDGIDLLVTVDCGITAQDEVKLASELGIDVLITDHHQVVDSKLPGAASAVINPRQVGCDYPDSNLAGVGVVFQLGRMLLDKNIRKYLDLVALGTIADVAPLRGENRILVRHGIEVLQRGHRAGIKAIAASAGVNLSELTAEQVAYQIAPRINAPGRLNDAANVVKLLITRSDKAAEKLARFCDSANKKRRKIQDRVTREAQLKLVENPEILNRACLVLKKDSWHSGVLGPAASALVERFRRPVFLLSRESGSDDLWAGSGRSIGQVPLTDTLQECGELLHSYGGHSGAAGVKVADDNLNGLADELHRLVQDRMTAPDLIPEVESAQKTPLRVLHTDILDEIDRLRPFGEENPPPMFCSSGVSIEGARLVGEDENHLLFKLRPNLRAIGFRMARQWTENRGSREWDIAYRIKRDNWRNRQGLQLQIMGLRPAGSGEQGCLLNALRRRWRDLSSQHPSEEKLRRIYRLLRRRINGSTSAKQAAVTSSEQTSELDDSERFFDPQGDTAEFILDSIEGLDYIGLYRAMLIFAELNLAASLERGNSKIWLLLSPEEDNLTLEDSPTYRLGRQRVKKVEDAAGRANLSDAELLSALYDYSVFDSECSGVSEESGGG